MTVNTTGIQGGVGVRLEIRQLAKNEDLFNMYLIGLRRMQLAPVTDTLSWYQVAGIHRRPYRAWNNVPGNGEYNGYCTHSSILFPSWHRPYVALFEQAVFENVKESVVAFPPGPRRDRYERLLPSFRVPYLDLALVDDLPDFVLTKPNIEVTLPDGKTEIPNPLFSHHFATIDQKDFPHAPWDTRTNTVRWPVDPADPATPSNPKRLRDALESSCSRGLRDRTFKLFTIDNFLDFATNLRLGKAHSSLEAVHDSGHRSTGGDGGNMSAIEFAAFDPIFWLHHCNIERLFTLWQVVYPDSYVVSTVATSATFWSSRGEIHDENTPLPPFMSEGKMFTSATVRNHGVFNSTYPELAPVSGGSPEVKKAAVIAAVQSLYGPPPFARMIGGFAPSVPVKPKAAATFWSNPGPAKPAQEQRATVSQESPETERVPHHNYYEYNADLHVEKYAVGGSFSVYVFIGDFTPDPYEQILDQHLVGSFDIFASNIETTGCEKCKVDAENHLIVTDSIPLTSALLDFVKDDAFPELVNLDIPAVTAFLKKHLHWRVHGDDGTDIPRESVVDLKIGVSYVVADVPDDDSELPHYGEPVNLYEVTRGRPCGINDGEVV